MHLVDALHVRSFLLDLEAKEASMYRLRYPETNFYRILPSYLYAAAQLSTVDQGG